MGPGGLPLSIIKRTGIRERKEQTTGWRHPPSQQAGRRPHPGKLLYLYLPYLRNNYSYGEKLLTIEMKDDRLSTQGDIKSHIREKVTNIVKPSSIAKA